MYPEVDVGSALVRELLLTDVAFVALDALVGVHVPLHRASVPELPPAVLTRIWLLSRMDGGMADEVSFPGEALLADVALVALLFVMDGTVFLECLLRLEELLADLTLEFLVLGGDNVFLEDHLCDLVHHDLSGHHGLCQSLRGNALFRFMLHQVSCQVLLSKDFLATYPTLKHGLFAMGLGMLPHVGRRPEHLPAELAGVRLLPCVHLNMRVEGALVCKGSVAGLALVGL